MPSVETFFGEISMVKIYGIGNGPMQLEKTMQTIILMASIHNSDSVAIKSNQPNEQCPQKRRSKCLLKCFLCEYNYTALMNTDKVNIKWDDHSSIECSRTSFCTRCSNYYCNWFNNTNANGTFWKIIYFSWNIIYDIGIAEFATAIRWTIHYLYRLVYQEHNTRINVRKEMPGSCRKAIRPIRSKQHHPASAA